jgi:hypothetical protein
LGKRPSREAEDEKGIEVHDYDRNDNWKGSEFNGEKVGDVGI